MLTAHSPVNMYNGRVVPRHCVPDRFAAYCREQSTLKTDTMHLRLPLHGLMLMALLLSTASRSDAEAADIRTALKGDATRGQALYNGKGICHYCHGVDGVIDKKASLKPETAAAIAKQAAAAPDLRNRAAQTLKDNKARFRAIREGHPGSGMFPDSTLSDQDITDILAYLAALRQSAAAPGKSPY